MTNSNSGQDLLIQSKQPTLEDIGLIATHRKLVQSVSEWTQVAILTDEGNKNLVVLLYEDDNIISSLRFCLSVDESIRAIELLAPSKDEIYLGFYQGNELSAEQVGSLDALDAIWKSINDQAARIEEKALREFFSSLESASKAAGRGDDIATQTKRQVLQYSHGRCMLDGCGADLGTEELTGYEGNFGYLAHNVGSSERAPRGGKGISQALSNDPKNILLFCDKHHRLVDKVAAADFSAQRLSEMRQSFKRTADRLLKGLGYEPLPCYAVLWPVFGHVIAAPPEMQIAQALSVMKTRADGNLNVMTDNNDMLVSATPDEAWGMLPKQIENMATRILQQTHQQQHRAALFAFGLMPALVGLGASLGNKTQIIPMLRFRDSGTWTWPLEVPREEIISITVDDEITDADTEVAVIVSLTDRPEPFDTFLEGSGLKSVDISAITGNLGNGCISHPEEGHRFMKTIHELLHRLVKQYGIKKVHLLTCASNTACVFLGRAIDNYHPEIVVYDFAGPTMTPRLTIKPVSHGVLLS